MTPKKSKDFIKPTAESLNLPEELVDDIMGFYWSAVRKAISDMDAPSITATNIGTFKIKYNKIDLIKKRYEFHSEDDPVESMTFNKHAIQKTAKKKLERLEIMRKEMEKEFLRKEEVKIKKQKYESNKNLEGEGKDIRRPKEQNI